MHVAIGTVVGAVVGTALVPVLITVDVVNIVSRWWYTPIMGAITGGFAGHHLKEKLEETKPKVWFGDCSSEGVK